MDLLEKLEEKIDRLLKDNSQLRSQVKTLQAENKELLAVKSVVKKRVEQLLQKIEEADIT